MPYDIELWKSRHKQRIDISQRVTHLTRGSYKDKTSPVDVLLRILKDGVITGSDTANGFIVGGRKAVCFQDAPLLGLAQNVAFEHEVSPKMGRDPSYEGRGLSFGKLPAWRKGARPVIYEVTDDAKRMLPENEWWRIVKLDMSNEKGLIDWTHEREWRCPDQFQFDVESALVVVANTQAYREFIEKVNGEMLKVLVGVTVLSHATA